MRKVAQTIATVAIGAGVALGMSATPAQAGGQLGLINIGDVTVVDASGANVLSGISVLEAANICDVNVSVLTGLLLDKGSAKCNAHSGWTIIK